MMTDSEADSELTSKAPVEPPRPGRLARMLSTGVGGRAPWPLTVAVGVVAVAAVAGAVVYAATQQSRADGLAAKQSAAASALAAGRAYSIDIASYDYRSLTKDFAVVEQHSTPTFAASYSQSTKTLSTVLTQFHAVASATIAAAGVESATTSRAVVLVFVNQTVTNTAQKKPTKEPSRVEIVLLRQHGQWLIDDLRLL